MSFTDELRAKLNRSIEALYAALTEDEILWRVPSASRSSDHERRQRFAAVAEGRSTRHHTGRRPVQKLSAVRGGGYRGACAGKRYVTLIPISGS